MANLYGGINDDTVLIESDTTDGSTVFVDASGNSNPVTVSGGNPEHSTVRSKFGASSVLFPNSSAVLQAGISGDTNYFASNLLGSAGLMIDFWVYLPELPSVTSYLLEGVDAGSECFLKVSSAGVITFRWFKTETDAPLMQLSTSILAGEWVHIFVYAMAERGTLTQTGDDFSQWSKFSIGLAQNGTLQTYNVNGTTLDTANPAAVDQYRMPKDFYIGGTYCYLDEFRAIIYDYVPSSSFTPLTTPYLGGAGAYYVSGTVKEGEVNIARIVRAYSRSTGALLGSTTSDDTTGEFTISNLPDDSEVYVICLDDDEDTEYNALIEDRVIPVEE